MTDPIPSSVYLKPAELIIAEKPTIVTTVLGSCVSITFFVPRLKLGAICHASLPRGDSKAPGKYVDHSINYMLRHFQQLHIQPKEIIAKLFGGADMFPLGNPGNTRQTIGAQNISVALATLSSAGMKPANSDIGGREGRKLIFYTHTGEVYIKRVTNRNFP